MAVEEAIRVVLAKQYDKLVETDVEVFVSLPK